MEHVLCAAAAEGQQPFYLYDVETVRRMCRVFRGIPHQPTSVHFACMANPHPHFLAVMREEGIGLFVNSLSHLRLALELGFRGERIVYAASAMDAASMAAVAGCGARVILDSTGQVALWRHRHPGIPFGVRCNIGGLVEPRETRGGYFIGRESRLGLLPDELRALHGAPDVAGLHLYAGTDLSDLEYFSRCYETLAELAAPFPGLTFLDIGGGFGVAAEPGERFPVEAVGRIAARVVRRLGERLGRAIELVVEPGRIMGAEAGWFLCRVTDVKQRQGRQLVGVNASVAQFPRPLLYPESARHPVTLLRTRGALVGEAGIRTDVFGCSTYSRDFLAREVTLPPAQRGDLVVLGLAGSYCASLYTSFLGFPRPREIFHERRERAQRERAAAVPCDCTTGA
jgi:diaminopimelate decarboxylase